MEFDEDDFIFIESDTPAEQLDTPTPSKGGRSKHQNVYGKQAGLDDAESSTSKPRLKRSFRTSPDLPSREALVPGRPGAAAGCKRRRKGASPDSEEERWLDALEEGKLEQVDEELKKMRNPLLMTARQRALLDKRSGEEETGLPAEPLLALPSGYREKSEMTAEMVERHRKKTERRREQAKKQREEDKKKTVSRLLNKSDGRAGRGGARSRIAAAAAAPAISYRQTAEGAELRLPTGVECPITAQQPREPPPPRLCGVAGCANPRRYSCSVTGVSLCSLECYRANAGRRAQAQAAAAAAVS